MTKNRLRLWPLYSLVLVFALLASGFGVVVYQAQQVKPASLVAQKTSATPTASVVTEAGGNEESSNETISEAELYPNPKDMMIKDVAVRASIAQTWPERIKGLSGTPYLPKDMVKLFVFDSLGLHSFWMKDMNYSIDIIWVDEAEVIVHIVENASPESYPAMFVPSTEARYVIETVAGFVAENGIVVGDTVVLPTL